MIAVTSTALVVLLAFVGVVWYSGRYGGAPQQAAAPSVAEYSVRLPVNIVPEGVTFTAKTSLSAKSGQAVVYELKTSDVTTQSVIALGRKLGFSGDASLIEIGRAHV